MTTVSLADRRTALAAALEAGGLVVSPAQGRVAPPCALIYGGGVSPHGPGGRMLATFRIVLMAARADAETASAELGELALIALGALQRLAGWQVGTIGPDTIRLVAGAEILTADVTGSAYVDPSPPPEVDP